MVLPGFAVQVRSAAVCNAKCVEAAPALAFNVPLV
jgi:hypothetical protein